jgi:hypothetical protein
MDICLAAARAAASRKNGAKSKGPKTVEGKARSAQNALKHGLRAQKHIVLPGESAAEFAALEAALMEELAPEGALQSVLAQRVVAAAWRLQRAERIEGELFAREMKGLFDDDDLGLALIRDGNGARAFDTLLRYRGGTLAEFSRALRTLKALQAEQTAREPLREIRGAELAALPRQTDANIVGEIMPAPVSPAPCEQPIKPEARGNPKETAPASEPGGGEARIGEADPRHASQQDASRWVGREGLDLRRRCGP